MSEVNRPGQGRPVNLQTGSADKPLRAPQKTTRHEGSHNIRKAT